MTRFCCFALLATVFVATPPAGAQQTPAGQGHEMHATMSEDERAIAAVVHELFDAMRTGDSTTVRRVFHPQTRMMTSFRRAGEPVLDIEEGVDGFVRAVGTPHEQVWDERIWDLHIRTDADYGIAWMNYAFFLGETFSHCGINLFQVARDTDGWRIVGIADTRRREGCDLPDSVRG